MKTPTLAHMTSPTPPATARASRRILVPLDLTAGSHSAMQYAARLSKEENSSVCLLHVVDLEPFQSAMTESPVYLSAAHIISRAERHLRMLAHQNLPASVPVRILVVAGKTAPEVIKAAKGICADLIVLTAPRHNWLTRLFSGDPTRWIESHAPCSITVLRDTSYGACDCSAEFESHPSTTVLPG
jgi:nucleotide-binding universal stress UspA family protein